MELLVSIIDLPLYTLIPVYVVKKKKNVKGKNLNISQVVATEDMNENILKLRLLHIAIGEYFGVKKKILKNYGRQCKI